ncbi:MAG: hypothetical protein M1825_000436 [Sarcosagium campestre]|nr:MAG: hypothetical protein M1825_000436 [Sarcosagium campestre]
MASYLLPSSFQKRLLRYALSRLDLLDTETLDLENLDIVWGKRSTIELRDLLCSMIFQFWFREITANAFDLMKKLSALLQLTDNVKLDRARVVLLRLTVPADIYNSHISVDIDGVEIHVQTSTLPGFFDGSRDEVKVERSLDESFQSSSHSNVSGHSTLSPSKDGAGHRTNALPTTTDLALSFLETEPAREKAELEAVIAKQPQLPLAPELPDEEEFSSGLGTTVSLPGFIASFLKGIGDRLQVQINHVKITVDAGVSVDSTPAYDVVGRVDPVVIELAIEDFQIDGVTISQSSPESGKAGHGAHSNPDPGLSAPTLDHPRLGVSHDGQRKITLHNIRLSLLSDINVFSNYSKTSSPSSPTTTHASVVKEGIDSRREQSVSSNSPRLRSRGSTRDIFSTSHSRAGHSNDEEIAQPNDVTASSIAINDARFADAPEEDDEPSASLFIPAEDPRRELPQTFSNLPGESQTRSTSGEFWDSDGNSDGDSDEMPPAVTEDLSASRIFSHEEAESMYLSAISDVPMETSMGRDRPEALNQGFDNHTAPESPMKSSPTQSKKIFARKAPLDANPELAPYVTSDIPPESFQGRSSRPSDIDKSATGVQAETAGNPDIVQVVSKTVLSVDEITAWVPRVDNPAVDIENGNQKTSSPLYTESMQASASMQASGSIYPNVPGAFSTYAIQRGGIRESDQSNPLHPPTTESAYQSSKKSEVCTEVRIGVVQSQVDTSVGRILLKLVQGLLGTIPEADTDQDIDSDDSIAVSEDPRRILLGIQQLSCKLLDHLPGASVPNNSSSGTSTSSSDSWKALDGEGLLQLKLNGIELDHLTKGLRVTTDLSFEKFTMGYSKGHIVSFDGNPSVSIAPSSSVTSERDFTVKIERDRLSSRVSVATLPIRLDLDLQKLDETLGWFGGFSSILGLGSSIASTATVTRSNFNPGTPPSRTRAVHFENRTSSTEDEAPSRDATKIDVRVGGLHVGVIGRKCSIGIDTTTIKLVSRAQAIGAQVGHIDVTGPVGRSDERDASKLAQIENVRLEYLSSPTEGDLGRLLSLLTPSKNKFGHDDDVLVDTLLRQRRQGAVLRVNVAACRTSLSDFENIRLLPSLGDELTRLSSVTKYLPEDDRPGLLILSLVREFNLSLDPNDRIGHVELNVQNAEMAHIGLPSLSAIGLEKIEVLRRSNEHLLRQVSQTPPTSTPEFMFMARMIGDELEPTVKVKLRNVHVEYSVRIVMDMLGLPQAQTTEELVAEMALSVANFADPKSQFAQEPNASSPSSPLGQKIPTVEIALHDCVIGLSPLLSPSKGLIVLSDVQIHGKLPDIEHAQVIVDISKASLLVIDDISRIPGLEEPVSPQTREGHNYGANQIADLCDIGFVAVGYVSAAGLNVTIENEGRSALQTINVDVRDDLLVLETCADSTQTLLNILNGLSLPTPPNTDLKYRTEVVPVQDMLASLSGNAFAQTGPDGDFEHMETVHDDEPEPEFYGDDDEEDESGLVSSFYSQGGESLYEEQGEESANIYDPRASDDFLGSESISEESRSQIEAEPERLPSPEPLVFHEEYFGSTGQKGEKQQNWDSSKNAYGTGNDAKGARSPLTVRIRDVHVIWNLFDGYDWPKTRDAVAKAVHEVEKKATEKRTKRERKVSFDVDDDDESVIGDFLFNSIYIGVSANRDPAELSNQVNHNVDDLVSEGGSYATSTISHPSAVHGHTARSRRSKLRLNRSRHHKMTFELKGIAADVVVLAPQSQETQSSIDVRIRDFEIFDHVPSSTWKKFATYMLDAGERESDTNMIHLEILNVKPVPDLAASEIVVKVSVLPLRLHVDQDALDFVTRFFEFHDDDAMPSDGGKPEPPFLQRVEVNAVQVKLDYKPKAVDYAGLRSGHTTEFMNFVTLDQADMVLRHVIIYGVPGFDRLSKTLNDIWMPDIRNTQLPGILAGIAPVRSLVNVGSGVRDLVVVPMREYRKDGRVVRSIQKGALAFAKTTTTELVKLGAKLAIGTQTVLQGAEGFLLPPNTVAEGISESAEVDGDEKKVISLYADQPIGVVQGLRGAYASLERDLLTARDAIVAVPGEILESGNAQGAARAVLKRAPTVIFRPAIGASKAISQTLMGATNSLDPQHRRRVEEKYKRH